MTHEGLPCTGVEAQHNDACGWDTDGNGRGGQKHDPAVAARPLQHAHGGPPEKAVCQHEQKEEDQRHRF